MGHHIQAFIARLGLLEQHFQAVEHAGVVPLPQGFALLPVTDALNDELTSSSVRKGHPHPECWFLSFALADFASSASQSEAIAYIEMDYTGGLGYQSAIVWKAGRVALGPFRTWTQGEAGWKTGARRMVDLLGTGVLRVKPRVTCINPALRSRAINQVLRYLGVQRCFPRDEFDALALGRFRDMEPRNQPDDDSDE